MAEFMDKMKNFLDKSVEVSKDALSKAGEKVQSTAEKSVLKIEVSQFESKIKKQIAELGKIVFDHIDKTQNTDFSEINASILEKVQKVHEIQQEIKKRKEEIQIKE